MYTKACQVSRGLPEAREPLEPAETPEQKAEKMLQAGVEGLAVSLSYRILQGGPQKQTLRAISFQEHLRAIKSY